MGPKPLPLTATRWAALAGRDARHDGRFVYAVTTTGIYCRPSCGARTPKREHVALFAAPADAESAGFRACRRCRPDAKHTPAEARVARARAVLDERLRTDPEDRVTLAELAEAVGWSPSHLQRTFTRIVGLSPRAYADAQRVALAKETLREGSTVLEATFEAGFGSGKALYERAGAALGMTPGTYRRGGAGLRIRYALFDTALGVALVATTGRGVCAVALGDDGEALAADLRAEFHAADLVRDDEAVGPWAEPVLRVLAAPPRIPQTEAARTLLALPADVRGTAFQHRVWAALREIPPGQTRSYGEVAAQIGRPEAARAVAQACGANPVALVVPCHRVVG
ncbi:MAG: methylated-DNA--[protein]-cysteine S-methyltransferase, partial [Rhodothermales bacterium]|nr:methylated-DNA--[protein]-cysteine S-methyltransferase [Rhodothermales bacterium]